MGQTGNILKSKAGCVTFIKIINGDTPESARYFYIYFITIFNLNSFAKQLNTSKW